MHNDIEYGIKITYSWGDEEPIIAVGSKRDAWNRAVQMAGREAATAGVDNDSEISLRYGENQSKITLHYLYDDTYCYYEIVKVKESDVTDKFRHMIERFECDFSLAIRPETQHSVGELQWQIEQGNEKLLEDIKLLQELSFLLRNGRAKIIEIER